MTGSALCGSLLTNNAGTHESQKLRAFRTLDFPAYSWIVEATDLRFFLLLAFMPFAAATAFGQQAVPASAPLAALQASEPVPLEPQAQQNPPQPDQSGASGTAANPQQTAAQPGTPDATAASEQQPKRILGVMPNFRAVSAGAIPPPPTAKQSLWLATQNSFDYSSFIFVGVTSLMAEGTDAHPELGKGVDGFGRYYWRGFVDKTDGNYLVLFALPTLFHEDERYYAMGKGGIWKRAFYSATRIFVTPNYEGRNTFNISELLGRAIAQGVSVSYYPIQTRTAGTVSEKYGYSIGRDALTNVFREFWPDIAAHVLHRHP